MESNCPTSGCIAVGEHHPYSGVVKSAEPYLTVSFGLCTLIVLSFYLKTLWNIRKSESLLNQSGQ